jgi:hypothetical protein
MFCKTGRILPLCWFLLGVSSTAAPDASWEQVKAFVERQLRAEPGYRAGDLLDSATLAPVFDELLRLGIRSTSDIEELSDSALPSRSYLVQAFQNPRGQRFMRQVADVPGIYDNLERLTWFPAGRELLDDMVTNPEGPKIARWLMTPEGLKSLQTKFAGDPRALNFHLPTGHIHTEAELLDQLKRSLSRRAR